MSNCGGARVRSKGTGLGPVGIGLPGFEPLPPHSKDTDTFHMPG